MLSTPTYIISYFLNSPQIGSLYLLPAHWEGGARASFNVAAKNSVPPSEGAAEGGCGGNSAAPERVKPRRLLVQSRTPKKSFVFLLEERIRRAQKEISEQNFSLGWRALASGGGAGQFSRSKKVRAKCIITAPKLTLSELIAPLAVRRADGSLRKAKSAFVFAVKSQSSLN